VRTDNEEMFFANQEAEIIDELPNQQIDFM